jgi:hypothetical protein
VIDINALKLVESVAKAYSGLATYRDAGQVRAWSEHMGTKDFFSTRFRRPSFYRFDYLSFHPYLELPDTTIYHGVVLNGGRVFSYTRHFDSEASVIEVRSIEDAVARITGESFGAAYVVARLLLDGLPGPSLRDFEEIRLAEDILVSGVPCRQVHCTSPMGQCVVAIETASLMIRCISNTTPQFQTEELRTEVLTNCKIDGGVFDEPFEEELRRIGT